MNINHSLLLISRPEIGELAGKAAAELRRRGWCQKWYVPDEAMSPNDQRAKSCKVCIRGAIWAAVREDGLPFPKPYFKYESDEGVLTVILEGLLRDRGYFGGLSFWNDEPRRKLKQVLKLLDEVANYAKEAA